MSGQQRQALPHGGQPVLAAGAPLDRARAVMIMVHGRGASAEDILSLSEEFSGSGFCLPCAAGGGITSGTRSASSPPSQQTSRASPRRWPCSGNRGPGE